MQVMRVRRRRICAIGALLATLVLAGCTGTTTASSSSGSGGTVTIAQTSEPTSFNDNTPQGGGVAMNHVVSYLTVPRFYTLDQNYRIVHNSDLGNYSKISDDPLTVRYTLKKGLKWSDGQPMTADDMMLAWAEASGYYNSATLDDSGAVVKGTQYFLTARSSLFPTERPQISSDNLSMTLTYTQPYADWELQSFIAQPAHVVARAAGVSLAGLMRVLKDTPRGDLDTPAPANAILKRAADFVNTGYDATGLPKDKSLLVSGGPLMVSAWAPKESMTFVKNPQYSGDHAVAFDRLVIRFIGDANTQVEALLSGEVDAIQPTVSAGVIAALDAAGAGASTVVKGARAEFEHLDLNFSSSVFSDTAVRRAFLLTVPREKILQTSVAWTEPKAAVLNSQVLLPDEANYAADIKQNGSAAFAAVDIDRARQLLHGATPTVKILYHANSPNEVAAFKAIQDSAASAGFTVTDGGSADWVSLLGGGNYDASIFVRDSHSTGTAVLARLFQIGNLANHNDYANRQSSDLALQSQSTLDETKLTQIEFQLDQNAFADAYGLPLYQLPGVFAARDDLDGIAWFGGPTGLVWNIWDWIKK
ncbi:MAG: ABC transporter family substrate-binding protein [Microbacteriaceae bacterium]|nr:MAG: ABC transporter family substrate-binding protein [Microbacteriaceae bacterium]